MAWIRERPLGLVYHDPARACEAYTLFAAVRGPCANLLDPEGRIVHRWHHPLGLQYARLLEDGNLLARTWPPADAGGAEQIGGSSGALVELDPESRVVWEYHDAHLHHDFERLESGNHLVLGWRSLPPEVDAAVQGGHRHPDDPPVKWGDVIQEIDRAGRVVHEWRSWEHLDPATDRLCPLESHKEWTHANSLRVDARGDWLVSFRLIDTVAIIERESGAFRWKWGREVLSHQHDARWLESGNVLVFDNGSHRRRGPYHSQIVEVDPARDEVVWTYRAPTVLAFCSFMVGSAERMANGNTFINEGATGRLFEVTPEGETVWEYVSAFTYPSRFGPTPAIFRAHRYAVDDPRLAGLPRRAGRYGALEASIARNRPIDDGLAEAAGS